MFAQTGVIGLYLYLTKKKLVKQARPYLNSAIDSRDDGITVITSSVFSISCLGTALPPVFLSHLLPPYCTPVPVKRG